MHPCNQMFRQNTSLTLQIDWNSSKCSGRIKASPYRLTGTPRFPHHSKPAGSRRICLCVFPCQRNRQWRPHPTCPLSHPHSPSSAATRNSLCHTNINSALIKSSTITPSPWTNEWMVYLWVNAREWLLFLYMHTCVSFCKAQTACLSVRKGCSTNQLIIIIIIIKDFKPPRPCHLHELYLAQ